MASNAKNVKAKIIPGNVADFVYPENEIDQIKKKENWGLAFSGGGTRSATLTLGQLRALKKMGIFEKFKYCSSVSGGTWGVTPFIFLDPSISDEEFLGAYKEPGDLTLGDLTEDNKSSMTHAISNSKIVKGLFMHLLSGDELFSRIIGEIFLKPFFLNDNVFFTHDDNTMEEILLRNDDLSRDDFYTVADRDRPFLIVNSIIIRNVELRIPFEMTPLYCGIKKVYKNAGAGGALDIGGGFVQPHGFDSEAPDATTPNQYINMRLHKNRTSIADMLGASGSAPAEVFSRFLPNLEWFPNFNYWQPIASGDQLIHHGYDFGDGGILENLGVMPLLRRKVEKIIVFVNGKTEIKKGLDENGKVDYEISDSIPALFKKIKNQHGDQGFEKNIVLGNNTGEYDRLAESLFRKQQKGNATIHIDSYTVLDNDHHDVQGGWNVKICWVYNSAPEDWSKLLKADVRRNYEKHRFGHDFPYFRTFEQNIPSIIDLDLDQTHLASQLASWMLISSQDEIMAFLNS